MNNRKKALITASAAIALTLGAATGVYAFYVRKTLSQNNTISIGNAEVVLGDGTQTAFFKASVAPYDGQFAPQSYQEANEAAQQDNGEHIATATVTLSRETEGDIFYGLSIDYEKYANNAQLASNVYVTCFEEQAGGTGTAVWSHVALEDLGTVEDSIAQGEEVVYKLFVTAESIAATGNTLSFDVVLESGPAPVTADTAIAAGATGEVTVAGSIGATTLVADAWYDGTGAWAIKQGETVVYSAQGATGGWQKIHLDGVTLGEDGKAQLTLDAADGSVYLKNVQAYSIDELELSGEFRTLYSAGETFSADGLVVTARYNDGSYDVLESGEYQITADTSSAGVRDVTISYGGRTATYRIAVVPDVTEENIIEFENTSGDGAALTLYITERTGEGVSSANSSAKGKYLYSGDDGYQMFDFDYAYTAQSWHSEFASQGVYENPLNDIWSADNGSLFVELGDEARDFADMRFKASGNEWHTKVLGWTEVKSITAAVPEGKTFYEGEFNGEGVVIDYTKTDGSTGQITATAENIADNTIQFFDTDRKISLKGESLTAGSHTVMVLYDSKSFNIQITVAEDVLTGIEADASGATIAFAHGEAFSHDGLVVNGVYASGRKVAIATEGYSVAPPDDFATATGTRQVSIVCGGYTATYDITISHKFISSVYSDGDSDSDSDDKYCRVCTCGHDEQVTVWGDRTVTVNGKVFVPSTGFEAENAGYGIIYDVTDSANPVFRITLNGQNTSSGGIYAGGLNITLNNNDVVIFVEEDVTIASFNVEKALSGNKVTVCGNGKLTVTDKFRSNADNLVVLSDIETHCTFNVGKFTLGAEDNSVQPELYIHFNGDFNGVETKNVGGMNWNLLSGTVTIQNEKKAYPGFSLNTAGDTLTIGQYATVNIVNFSAGLGAWNGALGNCFIRVYGQLNLYGSGGNANITTAQNSESAGLYVEGTYNENLTLEDWVASRTWSDEWSYDDVGHWHASTDGAGVKDYQTHVFEGQSNVCTVCGHFAANSQNEFSVAGNPNGNWTYGSVVYAWDGNQAIKNETGSESFTFTAATVSTADSWQPAGGGEIKAGWLSADQTLAIAYTFTEAGTYDMHLWLNGKSNDVRFSMRAALVGEGQTSAKQTVFASSASSDDWGYDGTFTVEAGDTIYIMIFNETPEGGSYPQADYEISFTK